MCAFLFACGPRNTGDDQGGLDGDPGFASLRVTIASPQIHWNNGTADRPAVVATLIASDGTESVVTDQTAFQLAPLGMGDVQNAQVVVSGDVAGPGSVNATYEGLTASVPFEVTVSQTVTGTADPSVEGLFASATLDSSASLALAYPPANALIPPNLGEMDVHWRDTTGKDVYEISLSGAFVHIKTYVNGMGAATWHTLAAEYWSKLSSGARGVDLTVRVRGLATASPATYVEGSEQVRIASEDVRGGVYYWNTVQKAVIRFDMTKPNVPPEKFLPLGGTGCVGCHAVSRDGSKVAYRREGGNMNYGNAVDVQGQTKLMTDNTEQWNFAAIHPNNVDMFITKEDGMHRTDLTTGATTPLFTTHRVSHPDVSPDGTKIVATQNTSGSEVYTTASNLVVFDYDPTAKTVSAPRTLVPQNGGPYAFYPSFSPDNQWVLFNRASGGDSYDHQYAEMWVTRTDGTGTPIHLEEAEVAGTYNSWPKWTPFSVNEITATGSEPVMWFTVATRRPFGVRSTGNQLPQLWMAPFYPQRAANGQPATGPMVRLPFQALNEGNHIAQWTEQIIVLQ
ncbi:MAG: hypothetical protein SFX73_22370 [Kofleriaceae bacterium]|nr:hypothetical protein [Kofleriaceae bacterium]